MIPILKLKDVEEVPGICKKVQEIINQLSDKKVRIVFVSEFNPKGKTKK